MRNFNREGGSIGSHRGGFGRGRKSFGGGRNFKGRNYDRGERGGRGDRQMFKAVCSNCGKDCEVPFNPTGDKPVYCSDCFKKMGNRDERRFFGRQKFNDRISSDDKYKAQLESVNAKLDKILSLLQPKEITSPAEVVVDVPVEKIDIKSPKSKKASKEKAPEVIE